MRYYYSYYSLSEFRYMTQKDLILVIYSRYPYKIQIDNALFGDILKLELIFMVITIISTIKLPIMYIIHNVYYRLDH